MFYYTKELRIGNGWIPLAVYIGYDLRELLTHSVHPFQLYEVRYRRIGGDELNKLSKSTITIFGAQKKQ